MAELLHCLRDHTALPEPFTKAMAKKASPLAAAKRRAPVKRLLHAALAMECIALGGAMVAGHAPTWLLIGLVVMSCAGVLLALFGVARKT